MILVLYFSSYFLIDKILLKSYNKLGYFGDIEFCRIDNGYFIGLDKKGICLFDYGGD